MNGYRILTMTVLFMLMFSMTASADRINTTIDVNEGIVLNGDIHIEVLDVGTNGGSYAKLKFYSYKDAGGKTETMYTGDVPTKYTSGTLMMVEVTLDSISYDTAFLMIESTTSLKITDRYVCGGGGGSGGTYPPGNITDTDGDGVPDVWDADNSTPAGYWVNSDGIGRMWGDMNGDGRLTSVDALMILQAAVGKIEL